MTYFKNRVVIVTGAANGLGKALATEFYKQGCHLALIDVDKDGLEKAKRELEVSGQQITIHHLDIADEEKLIEVREVILKKHKGVDVLVNNAGISISQNFEAIELTDYKRLFEINFWGTVYASKHFLPDLKKQTDSRLVNIISDFAFMGFPGKSAYASSKSAVWGFTNTIKTELDKSNVKVCFVVPPPMDTGLVKNSKHIDNKKRMNELNFLKKHGWPLDRTAAIIVRKIETGKYRIIVGTMMFWVDLASRLFPTLLHKIIGRNKKRFDFI